MLIRNCDIIQYSTQTTMSLTVPLLLRKKILWLTTLGDKFFFWNRGKYVILDRGMVPKMAVKKYCMIRSGSAQFPFQSVNILKFMLIIIINNFVIIERSGQGHFKYLTV
jgi:hypothetical protein